MNTRRAAAKQGATGSVPNKAAAEKQGSAGQARRSSGKNQKASSSSSSSSMPVIPQINAAPNPPSATMFPKMGHQTTYHCSWASVGMNGCLLPDESLQSCTRCAIRVHPRCQLNWESLNDYDDESTAGIYCCRHLAGAKSLNLRSLPPPGAAVVALDCLAIGWKRIRKCVNIHPYQPRSVALMAATN